MIWLYHKLFNEIICVLKVGVKNLAKFSNNNAELVTQIAVVRWSQIAPANKNRRLNVLPPIWPPCLFLVCNLERTEMFLFTSETPTSGNERVRERIEGAVLGVRRNGSGLGVLSRIPKWNLNGSGPWEQWAGNKDLKLTWEPAVLEDFPPGSQEPWLTPSTSLPPIQPMAHSAVLRACCCHFRLCLDSLQLSQFSLG